MRSDLHPTGDEDRLRALLEIRRHEIVEDQQRRLARIRETGSDPAPPPDENEGDPCGLDATLLEMDTAMLRAIDAAIERLDDGRYGVCSSCQKRIEAARLRALPFALCCQRCETIREQDAAHHRPVRRRLWAEGEVAGPSHHDR